MPHTDIGMQYGQAAHAATAISITDPIHMPMAIGLPLDNFAATTDPTVNDDSADGYSPGSRWVNLTGARNFTCVDATEGAAVWNQSDTGGDVVGPGPIVTEESIPVWNDNQGYDLKGTSVTITNGLNVNIPSGGYLSLTGTTQTITGQVGILEFHSDSYVLYRNDDYIGDIPLTFNAYSNTGTIMWDVSEDQFDFDKGALLQTDKKLMFRATGNFLHSNLADELTLAAATKITATTALLQASTKITVGTVDITTGLIATSGGDLTLTPNGASDLILDGQKFPQTDVGHAGHHLKTDGAGQLSWEAVTVGDVVGPGSATNTAIALYDGVTGKLLKDSPVTITNGAADVTMQFHGSVNTGTLFWDDDTEDIQSQNNVYLTGTHKLQLGADTCYLNSPGAGLMEIAASTSVTIDSPEIYFSHPHFTNYTDATHTHAAAATGGTIDHGVTTGKNDDDHTQYALLLGRAGGQTIIGGTGSGDDLTLQCTSHATDGSIILDSPTIDLTDSGATVTLAVTNQDTDFKLTVDNGGATVEMLTIDSSESTMVVGGLAGHIALGELAQSSTYDMYPLTDDKFNLGTSILEFHNAFFDGTVQTDALRIDEGGSVSISTGAGAIKMTSATAGPTDNAAWIPINYAGTVYYVPGWTAHDP